MVFSGSPHAEAQQPSEYQVKAAFLYNFANFVEWPEEALSDTTTLIIGVLGKDPFEAALTRFEKQKVKGRSLRIVQSERLQDLPFCHMLFINSTEEKNLTQVFRYLEGKPTLTVGEVEQFARRGGIINFVIKDKKVRFEINRAKAVESGLKLSSKLLKPADDCKKRKRQGRTVNSFRNLSIKSKLTTTIMVSSSIALLLSSGALAAYGWMANGQALVRHIDTIAEMIGLNSTAALAFDSAEDAQETLSALRAEKHVVSAWVYDESGSVFASYPEMSADTPKPPTESGHFSPKIICIYFA